MKMRKLALSLCLCGLVVGGVVLAAAEGAAAPVGRLSARYGSVPKGLTFEGAARGLPDLESVSYDVARNAFVLNDRCEYASPLRPAAFLELYQALGEDDRLGVSIGRGERLIVYGELKSGSGLVAQMLDADKVFGGAAFARAEYIAETELPGGFEPKQPGTKRIVVYINFHDFAFGEKKDPAQDEQEQETASEAENDEAEPGLKRLVCLDRKVDVLLIPTTGERAEDGGYTPDFDAVREHRIDPAAQANVAHIQANREAYMKLKRVIPALRIGEAAAFARYLRASDVDLKPLLDSMREAAKPDHGHDREAEG